VALFYYTLPQHWLGAVEGMKTIALMALNDMTAPHAQATNALLLKFPSTTSIACRTVPGMATAAHESTWADDYRIKHPETGDWHFIDLPFAGNGDVEMLCEKGCTPHAIADQIAQFQSNPDSAAAADALRFLIHFVGDAHQPLHNITNNDRGGNCIPLDFLTTATKRHVDSNTGKVSYDPELHNVWDKYILDDVLIGNTTEAAFANKLLQAAQPHRSEWRMVTLDNTIQNQVLTWATDAHQGAVQISYTHLVAGSHHKPITAEKLAGPATLQNCSDNGFQDKIAKKKVQINQTYVDAAGPLVEEQLEKAGLRLAALLDALWTSVGK
jgi:nuclease S1